MYPQSMFEQYQHFSSKNYYYTAVKNFRMLHGRVFVMRPDGMLKLNTLLSIFIRKFVNRPD